MSLREPLRGRSTFRGLIGRAAARRAWAAALGQRADRHEPSYGRRPPAVVADHAAVCKASARAVHMHLAAADSRRRQRSGFEESGAPEPAIEAYGWRLSVERWR